MPLPNLPYLPLFVQDWLSNKKLKLCSPAAHGLMINIMCLAHKEDEYGKVLLNQKFKQSPEQIDNFAAMLVKLLPFERAEIRLGLAELLEEKVIHIDGDTLVCNRMVRDAQKSVTRSNTGKLGGKRSAQRRNFAQANSQANTQAPAQANFQANTEYENEYEIENEYDVDNETDNNTSSEDSTGSEINVRHGKRTPPLWKTDFKTYLAQAKEGLTKLLADSEWIAQQQKFHPELDIKLSLEKASVYWLSEAGWKRKKSKRTQSICWKSTYDKALSMSYNKVFLPRPRQGYGRQPVSTDELNAQTKRVLGGMD